jgi:hypothetical protein
MSAAYYIVLEREIDGLDTMMNGKSLSRHMESLDAAATKLGVKPLSKFYGLSADEAANFGDEMMEGIELPPLEQFSARDGLTTVKALLAYTPVHVDHVVDDLKECEHILTVAAEHGVSWHFQIDV